MRLRSGGWQGLSPAGPLDCTRRLGAGLSRGGFQGGEVVKNLPANAGDTGDAISIPGSGGCPGEGTGNPLQCSCLENPGQRSLGGSSPGGHKQSEASEHKHEHQPQATTASLDSSTTAPAQPRPPQPEAPESSTRLQLACSCGVRGLRWVMTSPHCERRTTAPVCMEQRSSGTHLRSPAGGARAGSQAPGLF